MMATKLNAQVIIKNLQNMHEKSLPPTGARRRMELLIEIRFIKFNLTSRVYQTKSSPLD